jgi:uncharacterized protein (DUF1778 family)
MINKEEFISFRVSDTEKAYIKLLAKFNNMRVSSFIRELVLERVKQIAANQLATKGE